MFYFDSKKTTFSGMPNLLLYIGINMSNDYFFVKQNEIRFKLKKNLFNFLHKIPI